MLLVLIPIAWLAVAATVVALCRRAASADASAAAAEPTRARAGEDIPVLRLPGLTVWDCGDIGRARSAARALGASRPTRPARRARAVRTHPLGSGSRTRGVHGGTRSLA